MKPKISAQKIDIDESAKFGKNVDILCESIRIGKNAYIGDNVKIHCRHFTAGDYLYLQSGVEIGRGGKFGKNSTVTIGSGVGIFENTVINPSEPVFIGNNVGIGGDVMIWTHGAWLDVLEGFPAEFNGVRIEDNVWLPARSIVLPNVTIGKNSVITINSVVNRDIPEGSLAGGNPAKVIKENYYPKTVDKKQVIESICQQHYDHLCYKQPNKIQNYTYTYDNRSDTLSVSISASDAGGNLAFGSVQICIGNKPYTWKLHGVESEYLKEVFEDLRDFLRRNGVKIYNGLRFKSLKPYYLS